MVAVERQRIAGIDFLVIVTLNHLRLPRWRRGFLTD